MTGEGRGDAPPTRHVVVMGVSGAGKTTVARGITSACTPTHRPDPQRSVLG